LKSGNKLKIIFLVNCFGSLKILSYICFIKLIDMKTLMYNQSTKDVKLTGMKPNSSSGKYEMMMENGYESIAYMVGTNVTVKPIKKIEKSVTSEQLLNKALDVINSLSSSITLSDEMKRSVDALFNEVKYSDRLDDEMNMLNEFK